MYNLINDLKDEEIENQTSKIELVINKEIKKQEKKLIKKRNLSENAHIYPFLAIIIIFMVSLIIISNATITGFVIHNKESIIINRTLNPGSSIKLEIYNITNITSLKISGSHKLRDDVLISLISKEKRFIIYKSKNYSSNHSINLSSINNDDKDKQNFKNNSFTNLTRKEDVLKDLTFKDVCDETCSLKEIINRGEIIIISKKPVNIEKIVYEKNNKISKKLNKKEIKTDIINVNTKISHIV